MRAELATFVPSMPGETRTKVEATLDTLVRSADRMATAAAAAATPPPAAGAGQDVAQAFADRARAVQMLRAAADGLLGMAPLPVLGAPDASPPVVSLSSSASSAELVRAGTLLRAADHLYASGRRALLAAPGHAALPRSAWVGGRGSASWTAAFGQDLVGALVASPQLAPSQQVVLVTQAIALTPPPVPPAATASTTTSTATSTSSPAGGGSGTPVVPPTHRLALTAVVADQGNIADDGLTVQAQVQPSSGGPRTRRSTRVDVAPGGSVAVDLTSLPVAPGHSYTVTIALAAPRGEAPGATTSYTFSVAVAPPSPPAVTAVSPTRGASSGGTAVTVFGTGFTSVVSVKFGAAPARYTVVSRSQITATAPAGSGTVDVTVTNAGGTSAATVADRFSYRPAARR